MCASTPLSDATTLELLLLASEFGSLLLGLAISVIAYRGYRRNDSRPMLLIAVGFVLVVGVPGTLGGLYLFTGVVGGMTASVTSQASELLGMATILLALRLS